MNTEELPRGTVSFLFTDVEGSTALWQQDPGAMKGMLARHHEVLRQAIEGQGGYVFQIVGDAFCAAFATAPQALAAAIAAQRALSQAEWGGRSPLRVRMALHTGAADVRPSDYTAGEYASGLTLSRTARLLSAGHGGQILLSLPTHELVRDSLPADVSLRDLGEHRLKDLIRPEHVFQVVTPDLPADFAPLKTLGSLPNNLPLQLTSFVGRDQEIGAVKGMVKQARLVTLTGPGGSGKTRLALQVASDLVDEYADGVWLVDLSALSDPSLVPQAIATALGVREDGGRPLLDVVADFASRRQLLVVLDNCEHLVEACAHAADRLLRAAPGLRIIATSREALAIAGERLFPVPGLSLPDARQIPPFESLARCEAVRLFADRALAVQSDFAVTCANAPAVAQICRRLDGIPLAIELAAARAGVMSVQQIAARLDDRFRLLTGASRTSLPRQRTLRALIDWSWDLLTAPERDVLSRLAVFAGGWALDAAEPVCAGEGIDSAEVLDLLSRLVSKSLVTVGPGQAGETRYGLLETIRQYALEKLEQAGDGPLTRDRHLACFLCLAEQAEVELHRRDQERWLDRLEAENDNLRAALEWAIATRPPAALSMSAALVEFWDIRGYLREGLHWVRRSLEATRDLSPTPARVKALHGAAWFCGRQGLLDEFEASLEESLEMARQIGDRRGIALALRSMGALREGFQGRPDEAEAFYAESLRVARELGDALSIGQALGPQAARALRQQDYAQAEQLYNESLCRFRQLGDQREVAGALWNLAEVALAREDHGSAEALAGESLALYRELGDKHGVATALRTLGQATHPQGGAAALQVIYEESCRLFRELNDPGCLAYALVTGGRAILAAGDASLARDMIREGLALAQEVNDPEAMPLALQGAAELLLAAARPECAAVVLGAAEAYRQAVHAALTMREQAIHDRTAAVSRAQLGDKAFAQAWARGRSMTVARAAAYALESA